MTPTGCFETTPFPSWMTMNWFAATLATRSFAPLGHSTSMDWTTPSPPNPKVCARSLCEA
jgi:hypothetical protein